MKNNRANKGQFSIIAALLVSVILVTAVISTYTMVRHAPIQDSPKVLTAIGEMNSDIKQMLDFTVGYYGSILKVTGDSAYARGLTSRYLSSGLVNIAHSHPEWNPSFTLDFDEDGDISTRWFMPYSYSSGCINITYSLESLGISDVSFTASSALSVEMLDSTSSDVARINVTRDNSEPELGLNYENFCFYKYNYDNAVWELVNPNPEDVIISSNGTYTITIPSGVNQDAYSVQVEDNRGLVVSAFYTEESVAPESGVPHYTYHFDWDATGMLDIYKSLDTDTFVIEVLQNGTLKWLGQPLELVPNVRPIPPVAVKAFRVNATIDGVNQEVPFQVEDWGSDYMVPLGLSSTESIFNNNNMIVFLVNNEVSAITLWWDGNDTATQTPYAQNNIYFTDNPDYDSSYGLLDNSKLELEVHNFWIKSELIGESVTSTAEFLRVNDPDNGPGYGDQLAYVIYNGTVRDIVQQEAEYEGGVQYPACPNFYTQLVLTLPAGTTYYTYSLRTIFVNSTQDRTIDDLSVLQVSDLVGMPMTENGTIAIYPRSSNFTTAFRDWTPNGWDHHWSQFVSENAGAGIMFTNSSNERLYAFDTGIPIGAIVVDDIPDNLIEINPVELDDISFTTAMDLTWYGAVVTFSDESIYRSGDDVGLWVMVEHPPAVALDGYETAPASSINYVDSSLSNLDSSADKGTHSAFAAQKYGPDSIFDTLTEESNPILLDDGFEGSPWDANWDQASHWDDNNYYVHGGSTSAWASNGDEGYFTSNDLDASDASAIYVDFWFRKDDTESNDFTLYYYDGSNYDLVEELDDNGVDDVWLHYTDVITDSQYFVSNFRIRFDASLDYGENAWVDDVVITTNDNYELDLEVQWTHADFDETNEELCVYLNSSSGENLLVEVWNGAAWESLTTLAIGWNNVTVTDYLTSEVFTIRFVGETETGDSTQDYWAIDATLLKCWS